MSFPGTSLGARVSFLIALAAGLFGSQTFPAQTESSEFAIPGSSIRFHFTNIGLAIYDAAEQRFVHLERAAVRIPMENSRISEMEPARAWAFALDTGRVLVAFEGGSAVISPRLNSRVPLRASFAIDARGTRYVVISQLLDGQAVWLIGRAHDGRLFGDAEGGALAKLKQTVETVMRAIVPSASDHTDDSNVKLAALLLEPAILRTFDPQQAERGFIMQGRALDASATQLPLAITTGLISSAESVSVRARVHATSKYHYIGGFRVIDEIRGEGHRVTVDFGTPGDFSKPGGARSTIWRTSALRVQTTSTPTIPSSAGAAIFVLDGDVSLAVVKEGAAFIIRPSESATGKLNGAYIKAVTGERYLVFSNGPFVQTLVAITPGQNLLRQDFAPGHVLLVDARLNLSTSTITDAMKFYGLAPTKFEVLNAPHFESHSASRFEAAPADHRVEPRGPIDSWGPMRRERIPGSTNLWVASFRNGWVTVLRESPLGNFDSQVTLQMPRSAPPAIASDRLLPESLTPDYEVSRGDPSGAPSLSATRTHVTFGSGQDGIQQRTIAIEEIFERLSRTCHSFTRTALR